MLALERLHQLSSLATHLAESLQLHSDSFLYRRLIAKNINKFFLEKLNII